MSADIKELFRLSSRPCRKIIGLMSGTSLDGLDIALCKISGSGINTCVDVLQFETINYCDDFKTDVRSVFSKRQVDLEKLCLLNASIGDLHAEMINQCISKWQISAKEIDCIASHGQSIYHAPRRLHQLKNYPDATLQIGDGDHIAVKTGIVTLSDFRQKHLAAGGEGAPLALYGDYLMFSSEFEDRILLNIGGIANFTFLPKDGNTDRVISTDVGPGNTLIDLVAQKYFNIPYDKDSKIAKTGKTDVSLLNTFLNHPFFKEDLPKTTGPELFNFQFIENSLRQALLTEINPADLLATITRFAAEAIAKPIKSRYLGFLPSVYISGGGAHNILIIEHLKELLPGCTLAKAGEIGMNGDAKEAVLFAVLANETLCGSAVKIGNAPAVTMGKISLPH